MRPRIGLTRRLAKARPSQMAESSMVSARSTKTVAKPSSRLCRCASKRAQMLETSAASSATLAANGSIPRAAYRNRPNANEDVADPEEAAERFPIDGVLKVRRLRSGDQLVVRPLRHNDRSSV